jgi:glycosyltransferase involved in cell wall biosynthesis
MKILHIAESIQGGCGTYLNEVVPCQVHDLGAGNLRVLVPIQHVSQLVNIPPQCIETFARGSRSLGLLSLLFNSFKTIRSFQPDVIHLHSTFAGALVRLFSVLINRNIRIVYCPHGWVFDVEQRKFIARFLEIAERLLANRAFKIVAISSFEFRRARDIGIASDKLVTILNGISACPPTASGPAWNGTRLRILFVGRLDKQKGVDVLLRAVDDLQDKVCLRVIGAGVNNHKHENHVPANVEMLGWQPQNVINAQMKLCDVLVMPSRWEGFGLVAIEAMRCGKPVVATRVGGLASIVVDHVTGRLVEKDDVQGLIKILASESLENWRKMGNSGQSHFLQKYTIERVHQQLMELYSQAVATLPPTKDC